MFASPKKGDPGKSQVPAAAVSPARPRGEPTPCAPTPPTQAEEAELERRWWERRLLDAAREFKVPRPRTPEALAGFGRGSIG